MPVTALQLTISDGLSPTDGVTKFIGKRDGVLFGTAHAVKILQRRNISDVGEGVFVATRVAASVV